ncbi:MAG: putative bifunctional diguanylate cyclase/phosphodiesterase [Gemmatimonadota bacterium]
MGLIKAISGAAILHNRRALSGATRPARAMSAHRPSAGSSRLAFRVLLPYAVFAVAWLAAAERLLPAVARAPSAGPLPGGVAGWAFGLASLVVIYLLVRRDVLERRWAEAALTATFDACPDPVGIVRLGDGALLEVNERFTRELGYTAPVAGEGQETSRDLWADEREEERFRQAVRQEGGVERYGARWQTRDGSPREVRITARRARLGREEVAVLVAGGGTGQPGLTLTPPALHDPLTGLPNRDLLLDRLTSALDRSGRQNAQVAVLTLNLDRFKVINYSLGHHAGDELLVEVSRRVGSCLRREDTVSRAGGTVSRIGADEFTVVLEGISEEEDVLGVVERIREALREPFRVRGQTMSITAGIGIALSGETGARPETLLQQADIAMRRAKAAGPGRKHLFDATVDVREAQRLRLENDLREAIGRDELELRFQPIIALDSGHIAGLECLVRWNHPEFGILAPMEFIPIAEESGLILSIGHWVLTEACRRGRRWQKRFADRAPLVMAVNISAQELRDPGFEDSVRRSLLETGLEPSSLRLEITESLLVRSLPAVQRLQRLEVKLVVDDFGTGYSSLNYLGRLPVDAVKIDRSFIAELGKGPEAGAIVRAMMAMAETLELEVVAEGIETLEQLAQVCELGCPYGQGYLFRKPLPEEEVEELLAENPRFVGKGLRSIMGTAE